MDPKKSPIRRAKRQSKVLEDFWDCSVCTYRNTEDSFKCLMCDVRKGTSTRKPRLNSALVAQQAASTTTAAGGSSTATTTTTAATTTTTNGGGSSSSSLANNNHLPHQLHYPKQPGSNSSSSSSSTAKMHRSGGSSSGGSGSSSKHKHKKFARLKNVDRSTAQTREVTVNSVTVVITEYKPKAVVNRRESSDQSYSESNDSRS